jgi:hypothetical protein
MSEDTELNHTPFLLCLLSKEIIDNGRNQI